METLLTLDFDERRLGHAREVVSAEALRQGLTGERLGDFLVAVNECVVNAVEHGGGKGELSLRRVDGALLCEVRDAGPGIPACTLDKVSLPAPGTPGGRGIWLMRRLADDVLFATGRDGTAVLLSMRLLEGP